MKSAMEVLEPEIARRGTKQESLGVVVLGTIEGDIHDIGKNLVGTMLSAYGFEVHDMGIDVPAKQMVDKACQVNADILAVSALLTTTMMQQKKVVDILLEEGIRDEFKVLVGGAPVDSSWVETIGADGFGEDAIQAVETAKALLDIKQ
jgi:trimethylamine corrinoid protein